MRAREFRDPKGGSFPYRSPLVRRSDQRHGYQAHNVPNHDGFVLSRCSVGIRNLEFREPVCVDCSIGRTALITPNTGHVYLYPYGDFRSLKMCAHVCVCVCPCPCAFLAKTEVMVFGTYHLYPAIRRPKKSFRFADNATAGDNSSRVSRSRPNSQNKKNRRNDS